MSTLINKKIIDSVLNDNKFNTELKNMLNAIIDEELEKAYDEMDCDLIDECTNMLIELEQQEDDGLAVIIPIVNSKKIIAACSKNKFSGLSRSARVSIIACIILITAFTTNTAIAKIFDYNIAEEVATAVNEKLNAWGITAHADETEEIRIEDIPSFKSVAAPQTTIQEQQKNTSALLEIKNEKTPNLPAPPASETNKPQSIEKPIENTNDNSIENETPIHTPKEYTITFDAQGGICDKSSMRVTYKSPIGELPIATREGYEFLGWYNTDIYKGGNNSSLANVIKPVLNPDIIYNLKTDSVLKAKWRIIHTVTLNPNGGECNITSVNTFYSGKNIVNLPVPTREGYHFYGWMINNKKYTNTQGLYNDGDCELVAYWVKNDEEFIIHFDANGGTCSTASKSIKYKKAVGNLPVPTRKGWKFLGWFKYKNTNALQLTENTVFEDINDLTVYALWYKTTATCTFDSNGGECDMESKTIYSHQVFGKLPKPVKYGYEFKGWFAADQAEKEITSTSNVGETAKNTVLTAKWEAVTVKVTFDANEGFISKNNEKTASKNYKYMQSYQTFPDVARKGYKLTGWYTEPDGGKKVEAADFINFTNATTLYAHWEKSSDVCTIIFDNNNGTISTMNYNKGERLGDYKPINTSNTGLGELYSFTGWYTDKYYGENVDSNFVINEDLVFYAHWKISPVLISANIVKLYLEIDKTDYQLNEPVDMSKLKLVMCVPPSYKFTVAANDIIEMGGIVEADTGSYGKHTVCVKIALEDDSTVVTLEASKDIYVTGCTHNSGTQIANKIEPGCTQDGYSGDILCAGCGEILKKGTVLPAAEHKYETVVTKATMQTDGAIEKKCINCGNTIETEVINRIDKINVNTICIVTGEKITPQITVTDSKSNIITDYELVFEDDTSKMGKHYFTIVFGGNYSYSERLSFTVYQNGIDIMVGEDD